MILCKPQPRCKSVMQHCCSSLFQECRFQDGQPLISWHEIQSGPLLANSGGALPANGVDPLPLASSVPLAGL